MYLEVYPDIVFIINFVIDVILILLLKIVNKKSISLLRVLLSGIAGGVSAAVVSIFPWMNIILKFTLSYLLGSVLMIFIAFGKLKQLDFIKQWLVLNLITYFVGGFINSIYYHTNIRLVLINIGNGNVFSNIPALYILIGISLVTVVALIAIWFLRLLMTHRPLIYEVELFLKDCHVKTKGLMDTGNCLYDPISRKPVMVIDNVLIDQFMTPELKEGMEKAKAYLSGKASDIHLQEYNDYVTSFSYIPYRSVGKTGLLLGFRLDKLLIYTDKECICNEKVTAAICDNRLISGKEDYHVILHKELL